MIGAAPVLLIPAQPNAANVRTEAGKATSRHNAVTAANREFMITVSNRAGLHSQACDADDLWGDDLDKQWQKPRLYPNLAEMLPKCNVAISRNPGCTGYDLLNVSGATASSSFSAPRRTISERRSQAPLRRLRFRVACRERRLRTLRPPEGRLALQ
jgi:hypothetical protein